MELCDTLVDRLSPFDIHVNFADTKDASGHVERSVVALRDFEPGEVDFVGCLLVIFVSFRFVIALVFLVFTPFSL